MRRSTGSDEWSWVGRGQQVEVTGWAVHRYKRYLVWKNFILSCHRPCRAPGFKTALSYCQVLSAFMTFICMKQSTRSSELLGGKVVVMERIKLFVVCIHRNEKKKKKVKINGKPCRHLRSHEGFLQNNMQFQLQTWLAHHGCRRP
jgi:hypothetical protein